MPFRVELQLQAKDSRLLWTRTIHSYLNVSDTFKITFRGGKSSQGARSEVMFSVINKSRTTLMTTRFADVFFKKFKIEGELSMCKAVNDEENSAKAFSIWVSTKEMDVVFKDCAEESESWNIVLICGDEVVQQVYSNKLFIELTTKSEITKKYSVNYQQGYPSFDSEFRHLYYNTLKKQNLNLDTGVMPRVHRLAINPIILKNFLGMFPNSLEDFKIQVFPNQETVHLLGFNRHDLVSTTSASHRERPMNLKIVIKLDDIIYNNVNCNEIQGNDYSFAVNFKLRNFKSFVQLISSNLHNFVNAGGFGEDQEDAKRYGFNTPNKQVIDMTFTNPGDPIVFERCYFLDRENEMTECCRLNLVEVTDSEGPKMALSIQREVSSIEVMTSNQSNEEDPVKRTTAPLLVTKLGDGYHDEPLFVPSQSEPVTQDTVAGTMESESKEDAVPNRGVKRKLLATTEEKNEEEDNMLRQEYLGPTQTTESVFRIFE